jgi:hypothetical protein
MRRIAMEKINTVAYIFFTYLCTSGKVQCIGLILMLRGERGGCVDENGFCCIVNIS